MRSGISLSPPVFAWRHLTKEVRPRHRGSNMQNPQAQRTAGADFSPRRCPQSSGQLRRHRREAESNGRNQSITNFFKPATTSPDGIQLGSQLNGNMNESVRLAVPGAERFGKNIKMSSPARTKRKMPGLSPKRSPIIEAFLKVQPAKTTPPNAFESSCTKCHEKVTSPETVVRRLFLSKDSPVQGFSLHDKAVKKKPPTGERSVETSGSFSVETSTEMKNPYIHLGGSDSDSSTLSQTPESDVLKDTGRGLWSLGNLLPLDQSLQSSVGKSHSLVDCSFQISMGTSHTSPESERELNTLRMEPSEQRSSSPVMASLSRASNVSCLENGSHIKNGPCSLERESGPVGSSQFREKWISEVSSPGKTLPLCDKPFMIKKSKSFPLTRSRAKMSHCQASHQGLVPCGKRKRSSWHSDLQCTNSEAQSADSYLNVPGEKMNTNALFVESMLTASSIEVPHLETSVALPTDDRAISEVSSDCNLENRKEIGSHNSYPLRFVPVCSKYFQPNVETSVEAPPLVFLSMKKNKLSVNSHERILSNHSTHVQLNACTNSQSTEDTFLPFPSVTRSTASSELLATADINLAQCWTEETLSECHSKQNCKERDCLYFRPSIDIPRKPPPSIEDDGNVHSSSTEDEFKNTFFENSKPNGKLEDTLDSDGSFVCNLDSDSEDEILKPLEEIMQIASKPPSATPEKASVEITSSQSTITPSNTPYTIRSPVVYTNNLDRLLREKEDSKRLDEMEKKLKGDIEQGIGIFCPFGEEESNPDEEGNLTEEHRAFITKFSVVTDAIPDLHPGEEIFHLSDSGKLFNQNTLDLKNSGFIVQSEEERLILSSGRKQQLILITQGFLSLIYRFVQCPLLILKWLFQMMSVHSDYIVSVQILNTLMDITISNFSTGDAQFKPWIPTVFDVAVVFVNMGVHFTSLFPLEHLRPDFKEKDILAEMQTVSKDENEQVTKTQAFSRVPEANIFHVVKFLGLCTAICPEGYEDREIVQLLVLLFKIRLEKQLKQIPLVDFQCLLVNLLKNIRDWDLKMPEICSCISELSSHHHNLLKLVHLVPNSITRGRQVRRRLSLVIISKLLDKKSRCLPEDSNLQMSILCQYLIQMKPSALTKRLLAEKTAEQQNDSPAKLEQKAYYLTYSLLHLVNEASYSDACPSNQRKFMLQLCSALEKHVKCDIREDARLFYKTKVKDLVARIYGKWQEILHNSRPTKGKLHDYWVPGFESQSPTSRNVEQTLIGAEPFPIKEEVEEEIRDTKIHTAEGAAEKQE